MLVCLTAQAKSPRVTFWADWSLPAAKNGILETAPIPSQFDTAVLSWNAETPSGSAVKLEARAKIGQTWSKYYAIGFWTTDPKQQAKSFDRQRDKNGEVQTDTLKLFAYASALQIRATLTGRATLRGLAAVMSDSHQHHTVVPSSPNKQVWGTDLPVPTNSQMIYPDGGEVWCSPTSITMLLEYWGQKLGRTLADTVPQTAKAVWDSTYDGAGNWSFNVAYAASKGVRAYVQRLSGLAQAEGYIQKGVPLVLSVAWKLGQLDGAALPSTNGHLMVLRGFDKNGNPIINDPAAPSDDTVRRVYNRAQLERQWLTASGGIAYVLEAAK
jgi:Peptidase_C39 like family